MTVLSRIEKWVDRVMANDGEVEFGDTLEFAEAEEIAIQVVKQAGGPSCGFLTFISDIKDHRKAAGRYVKQRLGVSDTPCWLLLLRFLRFKLYKTYPFSLKAHYDSVLLCDPCSSRSNHTQFWEHPAESPANIELRRTNERLALEDTLFCGICGLMRGKHNSVFEKVDDIINHFMTFHGTLDLFACHVCSRSYTTKEELLVHDCEDYKVYRMSQTLDPKYQARMQSSIAFLICVDCGRRCLIKVKLDAAEANKQWKTIFEFYKRHSPAHLLLGLVHSEEILLQTPTICMKTSLLTDLHISCPECGIESFESAEARDKHFSLVHGLESTMKCPQEGCDVEHIDEMKMKKHVLKKHVQNGLIGFFMNNYAAMKVRDIGLVKPRAVTRNKIQTKDVLIGGIPCWDEDTHIPIEKMSRPTTSSNRQLYEKFDAEMLKRVGRPDLVKKFDFKHQDKNLKMCTKIFNEDGTVEDFDDMQIMDCYSTEEDFVANEKLLSSCSVEIPLDFESPYPEDHKMTRHRIEYCKKCNILLNGVKVIWKHHENCKDEDNYFNLFRSLYFTYFNRMLNCPDCGDWLCSVDGWLFHMYDKHENLVKYEVDDSNLVDVVKIATEYSEELDRTIGAFQGDEGRNSISPIDQKMNIKFSPQVQIPIQEAENIPPKTPEERISTPLTDAFNFGIAAEVPQNAPQAPENKDQEGAVDGLLDVDRLKSSSEVLQMLAESAKNIADEVIVVDDEPEESELVQVKLQYECEPGPSNAQDQEDVDSDDSDVVFYEPEAEFAVPFPLHVGNHPALDEPPPSVICIEDVQLNNRVSESHPVREETEKTADVVVSHAIEDDGDDLVVITEMIQQQRMEASQGDLKPRVAPVVREVALQEGDDEVMAIAQVEVLDRGEKTKSKRPANFKCTKCSHAFLAERSLTEHMARAHKDDFNDILDKDYGLVKHANFYVCLTCATAFHSNAKFVEHRKGHRGAEFLCAKCIGISVSPEDLVRHQMRHEANVMTNVCAVCTPGVNYKTEGELLYHLRDMHGAWMVYMCKNCFRGTCTPDLEFANHIRECWSKTKNPNIPIHARVGIIVSSTLTFQPADEQKYLDFAKENPDQISPISNCASRSMLRFGAGVFTCMNQRSDEKPCLVLTTCTWTDEKAVPSINHYYFLSQRKNEVFIEGNTRDIYYHFQQYLMGEETPPDDAFGRRNRVPEPADHQNRRKRKQPLKNVFDQQGPLLPVQQRAQQQMMTPPIYQSVNIVGRRPDGIPIVAPGPALLIRPHIASRSALRNRDGPAPPNRLHSLNNSATHQLLLACLAYDSACACFFCGQSIQIHLIRVHRAVAASLAELLITSYATQHGASPINSRLTTGELIDVMNLRFSNSSTKAVPQIAPYQMFVICRNHFTDQFAGRNELPGSVTPGDLPVNVFPTDRKRYDLLLPALKRMCENQKAHWTNVAQLQAAGFPPPQQQNVQSPQVRAQLQPPILNRPNPQVAQSGPMHQVPMLEPPTRDEREARADLLAMCQFNRIPVRRPVAPIGICLICSYIKVVSQFEKNVMIELPKDPPPQWVQFLIVQLERLPDSAKCTLNDIFATLKKGAFVCVQHFSPFAYEVKPNGIQIVRMEDNEPFLNLLEPNTIMNQAFTVLLKDLVMKLKDPRYLFDKIAIAHVQVKEASVCSFYTCNEHMRDTITMRFHGLHASNRVFWCNDCGKPYPLESMAVFEVAVIGHLIDQHGAKLETMRRMLKCIFNQDCGFFNNCFGLRAHYFTNHRQDPRAKIAFCGNVFMDSNAVEQHNNDHLRSRTAECCVVCFKVGREVIHVENEKVFRHELFHAVRLKFMCKICGFMADNSRGSMFFHYKERHSVDNKCTICKVELDANHHENHVVPLISPMYLNNGEMVIANT